jgi:hypothetical protein
MTMTVCVCVNPQGRATLVRTMKDLVDTAIQLGRPKNRRRVLSAYIYIYVHI